MFGYNLGYMALLWYNIFSGWLVRDSYFLTKPIVNPLDFERSAEFYAVLPVLLIYFHRLNVRV